MYYSVVYPIVRLLLCQTYNQRTEMNSWCIFLVSQIYEPAFVYDSHIFTPYNSNCCTVWFSKKMPQGNEPNKKSNIIPLGPSVTTIYSNCTTLVTFYHFCIHKAFTFIIYSVIFLVSILCSMNQCNTLQKRLISHKEKCKFRIYLFAHLQRKHTTNKLLLFTIWNDSNPRKAWWSYNT